MSDTPRRARIRRRRVHLWACAAVRYAAYTVAGSGILAASYALGLTVSALIGR